MKQLLLFLQQRQAQIYRFMVFGLTALLIIYFFPKTAKFKYEFRKGEVWLQKDLDAPQDFAIYKTADELIQDKLNLEVHKELFYKKEEAGKKSTQKEWQQLVSRSLLDHAGYSQKYVDSLATSTWAVFSELWKKGVVAPMEQQPKPYRLIQLNQDGISQSTPFGLLITWESAQQELTNHFTAWPDSVAALIAPKAFEIFRPNITYDAETTNRLFERQLENISPTRGFVAKGERIISKGEAVDDQKFQKLMSLKKVVEQYTQEGSRQWILLGQVVLVVSLLTLLYLFIQQFRAQVLDDNNRITFVLLALLLTVGMGKLVLSINQEWLFLAPFAILPVLLRAFFDTRLALFVHITALFILGLIVPNPFEFAFLQFSAGVFAIVSVSSLYRRSQLFAASAKIVLVYAFSYAGWVLLQEGRWEALEWMRFGHFAINGFLILLAYPLIYFFEKLFGFVSDLTLLELADTNQPLLRELAERAPGTFQHSLQVANLAEGVILQIGGNALLMRAGALYHDIGKMMHPQYFIENQTTGLNPHNELAFEESAEQIIGHVSKGIVLAKKHGLPDSLIDFIRTHHGTSKVQYFYKMYVKSFPEQEGDLAKFTYPGPKPFSRETAVLMMADAVEAASRSLKAPTKTSLEELVDKLVGEQLQEGQFDQASITLREIGQAKAILKKKLQTMYHLRVEYPE